MIGSIGSGAFAGHMRIRPSSASGQEQAPPSEGTDDSNLGGPGLSPDEQREVERLKARDVEVRRHEQAHAAAGAEHAGSPRYEYETGPDGKRYAVGGSVSIDVSPVKGDPEATIRKMGQVKRAALAPAQPSSQDQRVAAKADARAASARMELAELRREDGEAWGRDITQARGGGAYAAAAAADRAEPVPEPGSSVELLSCANCGSTHAP